MTVTNVTRGWMETIEYPDTIIVLGSTVNISENEILSVGLGQNVPNPFDCNTRVALTISQRENVLLQLMDASGKLYAEYNNAFEAGTHEFNISAANSQTYILNAVAGAKNYSIRMVNVGSGCNNNIKYVGASNTLLTKLSTANEFHSGDVMRYVGYAEYNNEPLTSETVLCEQNEDENIILRFNADLCENSFGVDVQTACDSYTWIDGITYTDSNNTATYTLTNAAGCDSVVTLNLTITPATTVTDYDGDVYQTLQIGDQVWMAENLRTTHYANGTSIALGSSESVTTPLRYYPNNSSSNVSTNGYLYNWCAVMNGASSSATNPSHVQGICPNGWHLPSSSEWEQLNSYVGSVYACGGNSESTAKALAYTSGWSDFSGYCIPSSDQSSNNASGFSAKPAGIFYEESSSDFGINAAFWSSTAFEDDEYNAYNFIVTYYMTYAYVTLSYKEWSLSVRCVRD